MRHVPQRSCIGCRAVKDKKELVRLVQSAGDRLQVDPGGKLPGRGAYLCPQASCLASALKRKGLDRAFRRSVPRDALEALEKEFNEYLCAAVPSGPPESRPLHGERGTAPAPEPGGLAPDGRGRQACVEVEDGTLDRSL